MRKGHLDVLKFIIDNYPDRYVYISTTDACMSNNLEMIKFVPERNNSEHWDHDFLYSVCEIGNNPEIAAYFINNGMVDTNTIKKGFETACGHKNMRLVAYLSTVVDLKSYL